MLRVLLILVMLLAPGAHSFAADLSPRPPERPASVAEAEIRAYLERKALVLMVRAKFDAMAPDEILPALIAEARRLGTSGPSEQDLIELDRAIAGEGNYYLVSIEYLIRAGGAAWPGDRPADFYVNDSLVHLAALADRFADSIASRADPFAVFVAAQQIEALADGEKAVPPAKDRFGERDRLVSEAMKRAARPQA